jgi:Winged helix-turn helix
MAGVIRMSDRELTRLRVMIDLADDRLTVDAAATLMGLGRRQIYRLRRAFSADGPAGLTSRKRGRPSNRKRGETFRATVSGARRPRHARAVRGRCAWLRAAPLLPSPPLRAASLLLSGRDGKAGASTELES